MKCPTELEYQEVVAMARTIALHTRGEVSKEALISSTLLSPSVIANCIRRMISEGKATLTSGPKQGCWRGVNESSTQVRITEEE